MPEWNPINLSNLVAGEIIGIFGIIFGFIILLFLLKKFVKLMSNGVAW